MHGIPSIGVNMHIDGTEEWEDEEADIIIVEFLMCFANKANVLFLVTYCS